MRTEVFGVKQSPSKVTVQNFCRDIAEILGEFLAAETLRSRRDLGVDLTEILTRSQNLGGQKLAENLGEILKSREISLRSRRHL